MALAVPIGLRQGETKPISAGEAAGRNESYWVPFPRGARERGGVWDEWRRLSSAAPPFLQPEFFDLTLAIAAPAGEPFLAVAVVAGQTVGVLPLMLQGRDLHPLRSEHSPRFDFCGDSGALSAIWEALLADRRWDRFVLGHIPAESRLASELPMLARRYGCFIKASPSYGGPYFPLPGFEQHLDAKFRANVRRCTRNAGDLRFERHTHPSRTVLADAFAIEAVAWKGQAGTSIESDARLKQFYRASLRLFGPRGTMSLNFVTVAGRRIACLFCMEDGRTLYAAKIGYDPAYAAISPGHLVVAQTAADAERRGLEIFDFLGTESQWKLKWTDLLRQHLWITLYRPSVRGHARVVLRKLQESKLAENLVGVFRPRTSSHDDQPRSSQCMLFVPTLPPIPYLTGACQRFNIIGNHSVSQRIGGRVAQGLGIKSGIRRLLHPPPSVPPRDLLGAASRFAEGVSVRVRDEASIRRTLDGRSCLRGLLFAPGQWTTCSKVYRVAKSVRRIMDDNGRMRPVSRTVLLDGVDCTGKGSEAGCGRHCPMMYRDDWLELAEPPPEEPTTEPKNVRFARIRPVKEILGRLDLLGQREGLMLMPEMARHAGTRAPILRQLSQVFEYDRWLKPWNPIYILEGLYCTGGILGSDGPCDRACRLLWHVDWLELDA
jgi:CelD/BcsL family acetyltransferase involved in cellulose biosynthesis